MVTRPETLNCVKLPPFGFARTSRSLPGTQSPNTIGSIYKEKGDYEEALKYYKQYAEKFPNKYESFTAIGGLYRTLGDYEQAKLNYEKASIIEPEKISVLRSLAGLETNRGHFEQALDQYHEALKLSNTPGDSAAVYGSLRSYHQLRGQMNKAVDYMEMNLAIREKIQPPALALLAKLGFSMKVFWLLVLYNIIFVLPLIVLLLMVYFGISTERIQQWKNAKRKWMRLFMGSVMLILGILLILFANGTIAFELLV